MIFVPLERWKAFQFICIRYRNWIWISTDWELCGLGTWWWVRKFLILIVFDRLCGIGNSKLFPIHWYYLWERYAFSIHFKTKYIDNQRHETRTQDLSKNRVFFGSLYLLHITPYHLHRRSTEEVFNIFNKIKNKKNEHRRWKACFVQFFFLSRLKIDWAEKVSDLFGANGMPNENSVLLLSFANVHQHRSISYEILMDQ